MAANNIIGLALEITANPGQAVESIDALEAKVAQLRGQIGKSGEAFAAYQKADQQLWEARYAAAEGAVSAQTQAAEATQAATEPQIVYGNAVRRTATAWDETSMAAERATRRVVSTTQEVNVAQGESVNILEALRTQYAALAADAEKLQALPFLSGEEAAGLETDRQLMGQIQAEAQGLGATLGEEGAVGGGIYESLAGMRRFRMIFAATIGLASFGFWVNEWGRLVGYLGDALTKMDGIHTAQNDIVMSSAFAALKQMTQEEQKQLMQPHDARTARLYEQGIQARLESLQQLRQEVEGLKAGTLSGQQYAKALQDIAAKSREFGLQGALSGHALFGSQTGVLESIDKQIQAYRSLAVVEQEFEQKQEKSKSAKQKRSDDAQSRAAKAREERLQRAEAAERAREEKNFEQALARQQKYLDRVLVGAGLQAEKIKEANVAAAKGVPTGIHGVPMAPEALMTAGATLQSQAIESSQHIDAETRAVWNLQAALLGLGPVMDYVAQKHQLATQFEDQFSQAMGKNIAMAIVYGNSIGQAVEKALKATIASIAAEAMVRGLFATGLGLLDLALGDFTAAAQAFEAAAVFGAVGGAAAAVGAAIPGGGHATARGRSAAGGYGRGSGSAQEAGAPTAGSPLAPGAQGPHYPGGRLTVAIMGDEQAGNWLASTLNNAVENQGTRLVSSHTKTSAPVGQ